MDLSILPTVVLPNTVALAAVALLGYLFGRSGRRRSVDPNQMRQDLQRAKDVVAELQRIAQEVRRGLATHHAAVARFRDHVAGLRDGCQRAALEGVCQEAEQLLQPTSDLVRRMASAYDELRQHSHMLMSFAEVRTDALTGLTNRRALEETLASLLALKRRYRQSFALATIHVDQFQQVNQQNGRAAGDELLKQVATLLENCVRETDIVARYSGEEFVVVMPETDAAGAATVARRIRRRAEAETDATVSTGFTAAIDGDDQRTLLSRADEALYAAKADGRNCIYLHTGLETQRTPNANLIVDEGIEFATRSANTSRATAPA